MREKLIAGLRDLTIGDLPSAVVDKELYYLEELLRWNKKINLTAVNDREAALEKHLIDSLYLLNYLGAAGQVTDLGSGGGLPVIPLAIARRDINFVSVESVGKKINFQKHIKRTLGLANLTIICSRIENLNTSQTESRNSPLVVARALAPLRELMTLAVPLIEPGGRLLAMKGPEAAMELATAQHDWPDEYEADVEMPSYCLPFSRVGRNLIIIKKKNRLLAPI